MTQRHCRFRCQRAATALALCVALLSAASPMASAQAAPAQRLWQLHEFSSVRLVPREPGAQANQHPVAIAPEALRQHLAQVQVAAGSGMQPLFASDELNELVGPIAQALAKVDSGEDVLLLSSSHRGGGILAEPTAVTARLFMQGDRLQLIVHDARLEFYGIYRGTHVAPRFTFGSRDTGSAVVLQSSAAEARRADWLSIPVSAGVPTAAPAAAAAPMPRSASAASDAADIERRLETLKRLRERNLITEEEYQQKRKSILDLL
jgi:hypothetical protein